MSHDTTRQAQAELLDEMADYQTKRADNINPECCSDCAGKLPIRRARAVALTAGAAALRGSPRSPHGLQNLSDADIADLQAIQRLIGRERPLYDVLNFLRQLPPGGSPRSEAGDSDGILYCYGWCGTKYADFPCDFLLPTPLWNRITTGPPFDNNEAGIEREGRGGVLCPSCIIQRLVALPECTSVYADIVDHRASPRSEWRSMESKLEFAMKLAFESGKLHQQSQEATDPAFSDRLQASSDYEFKRATDIVKSLPSAPPEVEP